MKTIFLFVAFMAAACLPAMGATYNESVRALYSDKLIESIIKEQKARHSRSTKYYIFNDMPDEIDRIENLPPSKSEMQAKLAEETAAYKERK